MKKISDENPAPKLVVDNEKEVVVELDAVQYGSKKPNEILELAKNGNLIDVVVFGMDADGQPFLSSSHDALSECVLSIELARRHIMRKYEAVLDIDANDDG